MANKKRLVLGLVSVGVSVGLIVWLVSRIDVDRAKDLVAGADWRWLLFALIITCAMPFTSVYRWRGVLKAQDNLNLPYIVTLRAVMMANVLNSFLPSKSGDIAKAAYLRKHGGLSKGVGTVILERLVDIGMLGFLGLIGYLYSGVRWGLLAGVILLGGVLGVFIFISVIPFEKLPLPKKLTHLISEIKEVFVRWIKHPKAVIQTIIGSFTTWFLGGLTVYALVLAIGADMSWAQTYSIFPLAILAGLVPITVSGIGTRDSAFVLLLSQHIPVEEATLIGIGYTLFAYWILSIISFPAVAWEIYRYNRPNV